MSRTGLVLETSALVAYAHGHFEVGMRIAETADRGLDIVIPATCLAEAYARAGEEHSAHLDALSTLHHLVVTPLEHDMCSVLGGWTRLVESLGVAQAAMEAATRPIVPIMSDKAYLIHRVLPKEWPIIDV